MTHETQELDRIICRLVRVEKENRRMKQAAFGVLVVACSVLLLGQARPSTNRTIEAENFVVRDASGKVRATFGMSRNPDSSTKTRWAPRRFAFFYLRPAPLLPRVERGFVPF